MYLFRGLHQALSHAAKCQVVEIAMISNKADNAFVRFLDTPLSKTNELHIVILQPLRVAFGKRLPIDQVVVSDKCSNPSASICRLVRIRWISDDDGESSLPLDGIYSMSFVC